MESREISVKIHYVTADISQKALSVEQRNVTLNQKSLHMTQAFKKSQNDALEVISLM